MLCQLKKSCVVSSGNRKMRSRLMYTVKKITDLKQLTEKLVTARFQSFSASQHDRLEKNSVTVTPTNIIGGESCIDQTGCEISTVPVT